jgi:queuine tRNA-ribosyltransferase
MFKLIKKTDNGIRIGELTTPHGKIETPFFMPVGTQGSVKGVSPEELNEMGAQIVLANTYHLYLRPGEQQIKKLGGLHQFMRWNKPILTDSGGYQVFSLGDRGVGKDSLVKITNGGIEFKSYLDGSKHLFTPEKVIQIQLDLGVDILMPLDVCPSGKATKEGVKEACAITIEWAKRSKKYFDKKTKEMKKRPLLHGIVQGGLDEDLRKSCAKELIELDFDGYSVGGLAVDHETRDMWETVKLMGEILPQDKQRYLMGVGTPDDIMKATTLGMDMFDCVLPTRMGRHGSVYRQRSNKTQVTSNKNFELVNLLSSKYRNDPKPIDDNCGCYSCKNKFSKAYISHLLRSGEILGVRLTTLHNLWTYLELTKKISSTI